jgi:hypothetical protein
MSGGGGGSGARRGTAFGVAAVGLAVAAGACIDWETTQVNFCNEARVRKATGICGIPDPRDYPFATEHPSSVAFAPVERGALWKGPVHQRSLAAQVNADGTVWLSTRRGQRYTGPSTAVLGRFPADGGQPERVVELGGEGEQEVTGLAGRAAGGVYAAGHFQGALTAGGSAVLQTEASEDGFVAALGPDGEWLSGIKLAAGANARVRLNAVAVLPSGEVVVAGRASGGLDLAAGFIPAEGQDSALILRLGEDLSYRWHALSSGCVGEVDALAVGPDGTLYAAGRASGVCSFGGMATGTAGGKSFFVVRYPPSPAIGAAPQWIGTPQAQADLAHFPALAAAAPSGGVYVVARVGWAAGRSDGGITVHPTFLSVFDDQGNMTAGAVDAVQQFDPRALAFSPTTGALWMVGGVGDPGRRGSLFLDHRSRQPRVTRFNGVRPGAKRDLELSETGSVGATFQTIGFDGRGSPVIAGDVEGLLLFASDAGVMLSEPHAVNPFVLGLYR